MGTLFYAHNSSIVNTDRAYANISELLGPGGITIYKILVKIK